MLKFFVTGFRHVAIPLALLAGPLAACDAQAAEQAAAAAAATQNTFDITEFRVLDNHVLTPTAIESAVYPYLGPGRNIDWVKKAADALEKAYKDAGFGAIYVDIPEQQVDEGIVRLKVTEGRLERIHLRGERYFSGRKILAALPALEVEQTPNLPALQQQLTELNARTPDRSITPILKAGAEPGTVDVDLAVKDTLPLHGSIDFDNRHSADTTPDRATAALSYDNLWQRQDSVSLRYQTAPARMGDAEVFMANYLGHLDPTGTLFNLSYVHTSSNVLALGTLGVLGKGAIYGAHWIDPLTNTADNSQSLNAGVEYKDVLTTVQPDSTTSASAAPVTAQVRYLNWSLTYTSNWQLPSQMYSLSAGIGLGVRSGFNTVDEFANARFNARPDYIYLRLGFTGSQSLFAGLAVAERASGQLANSPLVNNEQFSLGGVDTVRGYLEAETLGDSGFSSSLELHSPMLGSLGGTYFAPLYAFAFVDGGVATLVNPLPGQRENVELWSTGLGLRLQGAGHMAASIDYAVPERSGIRTKRSQPRVDFLLHYGF